MVLAMDSEGNTIAFHSMKLSGRKNSVTFNLPFVNKLYFNLEKDFQLIFFETLKNIDMDKDSKTMDVYLRVSCSYTLQA